MRHIVIDTETTGLDPLDGDRIVEIGAVELVNRSLTGQTFHCYLCPERSIPANALAVHGLSVECLADRPLFADVADELLAFVGELLAGFCVEPTTKRQAALQLDPIALAIVIKPPIAKRRPQPFAPHFRWRSIAASKTSHKPAMRRHEAHRRTSALRHGPRRAMGPLVFLICLDKDSEAAHFREGNMRLVCVEKVWWGYGCQPIDIARPQRLGRSSDAGQRKSSPCPLQRASRPDPPRGQRRAAMWRSTICGP
jgi:hypothetical protein